ncbi:MAG: cytochrome b N-terminal domain-containing protein [Deltaproteobacteria bacterium]|nr:cytochrome b N-terminal domain-containing protein [Deltaproteobacteria bacterium]
MSFVADVVRAARALPQNLRHDLHPGVSADDSPGSRLRRSFLYHLFPLRVTERALAPATTFGLGLVSVALFILLTVTGLLLMFYYVPTPRDAYGSMLDIDNVVTFGRLCRRLHRFGADLMVAVVLLHLVRVVAQAAYRRRELNWLIGLGLASLLVGLAFTGYLLPWDQRSYWAVRVVTELLGLLPVVGRAMQLVLVGGAEVGAATLSRFYALHVALLPLGMLGCLVWHLWRIRKDGGLAAVEVDPPTVAAWPHLVLRVSLVLLGTTALVLFVALVQDAPLAPLANPLRPENPEKAPWYFLAVQEMVSYSALTGGVVIPVLTALGFLALPFLDRADLDVGYWLGARGERRTVLVAVVASGVVLGLGTVAYLTPELGAVLEALPPWAHDVLNPAGLMLCWTALVVVGTGLRTDAVRPALRAGIGALFVGLCVFTLLGMLRGPDWGLASPWEAFRRVF